MDLERLMYLGFNQNDKVIQPWLVYVLKDPNITAPYPERKYSTYLIVYGTKKRLSHKVVCQTQIMIKTRIRKQREKGYLQKDNLKIMQTHFPNLLDDLNKLVFWETIKNSE